MILGFEIYRQNKKLEKIDKGRKILEIRQRGIEVIPRTLKYAVVFLCFLLVIGIIVNAIYENDMLIPLLAILIANLVVLTAEKRYEIYEKGIRYGMVFVE